MKVLFLSLFIETVMLALSIRLDVPAFGISCIIEHFPKSIPISVISTVTQSKQTQFTQGIIKIRNNDGNTLSERDFLVNETNTVLPFNTQNDEELTFCVENINSDLIIVDLLIKSEEHYEPEENLPTQGLFNVLDSALGSVYSLLNESHTQIADVDKSMVMALNNGASFENKVTYFSSGTLVVIGILGLLGTCIVKSEIQKKKRF